MYKISIPLDRPVFPGKMETMAEIHTKAFRKELDLCSKLAVADPDKIIPNAIKTEFPEWKEKEWVAATKEYFLSYQDYVQNDSKNLLIATEKTLALFVLGELEIRNKIFKKHFASLAKKEYGESTKHLWKYWKKLLNNIFSYKKFSEDNPGGWCAGKFIECLDIHACCYCNADIIYSHEFQRDKTTRYRSDLDHFYPKGEYPYLALSLYNLVPACNRCNTKLKKDKKPSKIVHIKKLINPYCENLHDYFQFVFAPETTGAAGQFPPEGKARPLPRLGCDAIARPNLKTFAIDDVYNKLYDFVVKDVVMKRSMLDTGYGKWLRKKLHFLDSLYISHALELSAAKQDLLIEILEKRFREEWKHRFFDISFNPKDINKRPFSKLIIDLAGDL